MTTPLADGSGSVELPQHVRKTMLGDTAGGGSPSLMMNATNISLVKENYLPLMNLEIQSVADEYVKWIFGQVWLK